MTIATDNRIAFVTAGDPSRRTGGYLYNRQILDALAEGPDAPRVEQIVLPESLPADGGDFLRDRLAALRPAVTIVDSIVLVVADWAIDVLRRAPGIRIIALMHMLPSDLHAAQGAETVRLVAAERRLLAAADRVIAVSPALGARLVQAGAARERVTVIPPGRDGPGEPSLSRDILSTDGRIDLPAMRRAATGDCDGRGSPPWLPHLTARCPPSFLAVANWSEAKGIHLIVDALACLGLPVTLDLVGEASDSTYARRVRAKIARHGLGERVRIRGSLAPDALVERYRGCDVFVLPSRSEGFGTVYAEAMSFGKPVIAARVGPLPWLVGDHCGLLVPPDDVAALAAAMRMVATDADLRHRLGQSAFRRAQRLPTWAESAAAFREIVRGMLA